MLEAINSLRLLIPLVSPYWQYYLSKIKIINLYTFVVSLLGVKMFLVWRCFPFSVIPKLMEDRRSLFHLNFWEYSCIDNNLDLDFYYFKFFISPTFQDFLGSGILIGPKVVEKGVSNSNKFNKEICPSWYSHMVHAKPLVS